MRRKWTVPLASERTPVRRGRLNTDELVLQPWFLTKRQSQAIRYLVPPDYRQRMVDYFQDWGCMRCGCKDVPYKSNGMCRRCMHTVYEKLQISARRRLETREQRRYGEEFIAKAKEARKLLSGISRAWDKKTKRPSVKSIRLASPIIDTFDRFSA